MTSKSHCLSTCHRSHHRLLGLLPLRTPRRYQIPRHRRLSPTYGDKLGLVQRKDDKLECDAGDDMVNKPVAESWQKLRRVVNVQPNESVSQKLIRSYSVSCRNPCRMAGLINSLRAPEAKGNVLNGRQEFTLQRNQNARYSPNNLDTGFLRFCLMPLKSYRRRKSGKSSL